MTKNLSIRKKIYSISILFGFLFILSQIILFNYSTDVKSNWDKYDTIVKTKMELLSEMYRDFGYGGMIHNFKNYLIRGDEENLNTFYKKYNEAMSHKNEYLKLKDVSEFEIKTLYIIENTFKKYKNQIEIIESQKKEGHSIMVIDSLVKIDDKSAFEAMSALDVYFSNIRNSTRNKIHSSINSIYYISLTLVFSVFVLILFTTKFFENTIIKPLIEIEIGLLSFFRFLSNKKHKVNPISVIRNDEFGIMAKSINKNIVLATNLHNNVTFKNNELQTLISSFGENVIASNTNLDGIITYASKAFEKISGYTNEELVGKSHNVVRHPDTPDSVFNDLWSTIKKGNVWQGEIKNKNKNGNYYIVQATISPLYDEENRHIGYSGIRENITYHKEVEVLNEQLDVYKNHLESKVKKSTSHIEDLMGEIEETQKEIVFTMGAIGERRSEETGNHVRRVAEYSKLFALYYGIEEKEAEMLKQASPMHDIGKVGISDAILNKKGKLTTQEYDKMKEHAVLGYNMIKSSNRPLLKMASIVAHEHHEKYDGSGYPRGLKGEDIHIYGRITAIADVFDALGSHRCYKKAWSDEKIFDLFQKEKGNHFDPKLIEIFFEHLDEFLKIRDKFLD